MNYKVKNAISKNKNALIIVAILWVILSIVLVSPITVSIVEATVNRSF